MRHLPPRHLSLPALLSLVCWPMQCNGKTDSYYCQKGNSSCYDAEFCTSCPKIGSCKACVLGLAPQAGGYCPRCEVNPGICLGECASAHGPASSGEVGGNMAIFHILFLCKDSVISPPPLLPCSLRSMCAPIAPCACPAPATLLPQNAQMVERARSVRMDTVFLRAIAPRYAHLWCQSHGSTTCLAGCSQLMLLGYWTPKN
jgi:hypothetical protein